MLCGHGNLTIKRERTTAQEGSDAMESLASLGAVTLVAVLLAGLMTWVRENVDFATGKEAIAFAAVCLIVGCALSMAAVQLLPDLARSVMIPR